MQTWAPPRSSPWNGDESALSIFLQALKRPRYSSGLFRSTLSLQFQRGCAIYTGMQRYAKVRAVWDKPPRQRCSVLYERMRQAALTVEEQTERDGLWRDMAERVAFRIVWELAELLRVGEG